MWCGMSDIQQTERYRDEKFWASKRVLVTGGAGFIGSHLVDEVTRQGAHVRVADSLTNGSLENLGGVRNSIEFIESELTKPEDCLRACQDVDVVLNLAAKVAGVAYNSSYSAEMFQTNLRIGLNMLDAARKCDVGRFLVVSSACVY